jgi:acetyl esterase
MLSPEARQLLATAPERPPRDSVSLQENREALRRLLPVFGTPFPSLPVTNLTLECGVRVRVYLPEPEPESRDARRPCLVYCHGGGWALGDLDTHDALCRRITVASRWVLVAVDYRRPPEHPFPAALDDVTAAVVGVHGLAERLHLDPRRIAVGGDSAGGNLSAAACSRLRGTPHAPCHQLLIMPTLDNRPELWPSYERYGDGFSMTRADMEWYFRQYLGDDWRAVTDPEAVPMRAADLSDLPPATVLTAGCDPLRDEGEAYAVRLREQGIPTSMRRIDGVFHPFILYGESLESARNAVAWIGDRLSRI